MSASSQAELDTGVVRGIDRRVVGRGVGHVYVEARVFARRSAVVRFLVDTGATYSIVPPALARKVGAIPAPATFHVTLADGSKRSLKACTLGIELFRREIPMTALLLSGAEPLLGVEALEALGFRVNPSKRTLEPTRAQAALLVSVRPSVVRPPMSRR
jgi:clan AA aspartic protease